MNITIILFILFFGYCLIVIRRLNLSQMERFFIANVPKQYRKKSEWWSLQAEYIRDVQEGVWGDKAPLGESKEIYKDFDWNEFWRIAHKHIRI